MRAALVALLAASLGAPALAAEPVSKVETRRLPPAEVQQRIVDLFGETLIVPSQKPGGPKPTRALDRQRYATQPRATEVSGVCRTDFVTFLFEPADPALQLQPGDIPMRVYGLEVRPAFRSLRPPGAIGGGNPDLVRDRHDCAELTGQAERFAFTAAEDVVAYATAARLLAEAQATVGRPGGPPLECLSQTPGAAQDCRKPLMAFNPNSALYVVRCAPRPATAAACLRLDAWATAVEISADAAGKITAVTVRDEQVVSEQWPD